MLFSRGQSGYLCNRPFPLSIFFFKLYSLFRSQSLFLFLLLPYPSPFYRVILPSTPVFYGCSSCKICNILFLYKYPLTPILINRMSATGHSEILLYIPSPLSIINRRHFVSGIKASSYPHFSLGTPYPAPVNMSLPTLPLPHWIATGQAPSHLWLLERQQKLV